MDTSRSKEQMKVIGADGRSVGTVDRIEGDKIRLTKKDSEVMSPSFDPVGLGCIGRAKRGAAE